jgi:hypothetical protein
MQVLHPGSREKGAGDCQRPEIDLAAYCSGWDVGVVLSLSREAAVLSKLSRVRSAIADFAGWVDFALIEATVLPHIS